MGKTVSFKVINCAVCGKETRIRRTNAKYCSDACKAKAHRQRRRAAKINELSEVPDGAVDSFELLKKINTKAGGLVLELERQYGRPAARLGLQIFDALLEQGLVISKRAK